MWKRLSHSMIVFGLAVLAYWAYAAVVVPLVEPVATRSSSQGTEPQFPQVLSSRYLETLFPADSWERNKPKVLETDHGALLFRDYQPQDDGTIELKPVTLVYFPGGENSNELPVLVQAPQGAVLETERGSADNKGLSSAMLGLNGSRGEFGKPVRARLIGNVFIRRPRSQPDRDDELFVSTRNVQIDRQRIWTPNEVEFRFGPHWGRGRDLQIRFHDRDGRPATERTSLGAVRELELAQIEKVLIAAEDGLLSRALDGNTPASVPTASNNAPSPPIEVHCRGAFRFHFLDRVASLSDDVRLTRRFSESQVDSLSCSILEVHFAEQTSASETSSSESSQDKNALAPGGMQLGRFLAKGTPVVLEAPSENAFARADYIECHYAQRRIVLEGTQGAWLKHQQTEMEAQRLDYLLHPTDSRRLGTLEAAGPGRVLGVTENQTTPRPFEATWTQSLQLRPHDDRHVLSLFGRAQVQFIGSGGFSANELHLFLFEEPVEPPPMPTTPPATPPTSASASTPSPDAPQKPVAKMRLRPDRLVATGNVRVDSLWLKSQAPSQELKVWFVPSQGMTTIPPEGASDSAPPAPTNSANPLNSDAADGPPMEFQGNIVEIRVLASDTYHVDDVTVAGNVRILRPPAEPGGYPLLVSGELLHVAGLSRNEALVTVQGQPAEAGAEGLLLRGTRILLDRRANRMTIPGPGEIVTPRQPVARPGAATTQVPPMTITWSHGLEFDGRQIVLQGQVNANGEHTQDNGDVAKFAITGTDMWALLTDRVDFMHPPKNRAEAVVDLLELGFQGEVQLQNHTYGPDRQLKTWEESKLRNVTLNHLTGRLTADGPGWMSSVRFAENIKLVPTAATSPGGDATHRATNAGRQLVHMQVHFDRQLTGNLASKEIQFFERVRAIYGPVTHWEERIDPLQAATGPDRFELNSDHLQLMEMPPVLPSKTPRHEMIATGNVHVWGDTFDARGHRLSYDDSKDLMVLAGRNGRDLASIRSSWLNGNAEAREIHLWPKSKLVKSEKIQGIDINLGPLGAPKPPSAPPRR